MIDYKNELNEAQYKAVEYCDGPLLVIAGAGSGKTRALTYKIAYLLEHGYSPYHILSLTFTNKAAKEMVQRIAEKVGGRNLRNLWCGTFHSVFSRILRIEAHHIGFHSNFTIYDSSDSQRLIKNIVREMGLDEKVYKARKVANRISDAKNKLILPITYASTPELVKYDKYSNMGEIKEIYQRYMERCKANNALDFDDLLLYFYLLLYQNSEVREKYRQRFRYVLVDEYQDTNVLQYKIIQLLLNKEQRLCVVGDDSQSIYAFRGAEISNILNFQRDYPTAKLVKLEQNYRSTQTIVNAANSVIDKNKSRIPKKLYSENVVGAPIYVCRCYDEKDEASRVYACIQYLHTQKGVAYSDIAVLYRTNAQSRNFEKLFREMKLHCRVLGALSFYQRKEVKDLLAYFSVVSNPIDDMALRRIINYPTRGIGATTLLRLQTSAAERGLSLWEMLVLLPQVPELNVNKGARKKIMMFVEALQYFRRELHTAMADVLAEAIMKYSGIVEELDREEPQEAIERKRNIKELLQDIHEFTLQCGDDEDSHPYLDEYMAQVSLLTSSDGKDGDKECLSLSTIHAVKGLEFAAVFVTGMEENLFPDQSKHMDSKEMEEERRLFYVALTRPKEYCFLTYAERRMVYGQFTEGVERSTFLYDIAPQYLQSCDKLFGSDAQLRPKNPPRQTISPSPSLQAMHSLGVRKDYEEEVDVSEEYGIRVGTRISHQRFGEGEVLKIEGTGMNTKATISFPREGSQKKLLLKFAKFDVLAY